MRNFSYFTFHKMGKQEDLAFYKRKVQPQNWREHFPNGKCGHKIRGSVSQMENEVTKLEYKCPE